jgi:hypothetical protein
MTQDQCRRVNGAKKPVLFSQWRNETGHLSLAIKQVMHPAYQRIIGLGPVAIPLILRELQREPDHWFWALEAITGEKPAYLGSSVAQAAQAWLQWGKERLPGYF